MLVLSRRPSQKVVLPDLNVAVEVLSVRGNVVRLGISAPPDVPVVREELLGNPHAAPRPPAGRLCPA